MRCRQRKNNGKLPAVNITQVVSHHVVHQELKMSVIHSLCTQTARQHSLINSGSQNQNPSIANTEQHCNSHSWFWYIIIIIIKKPEHSDNRIGLSLRSKRFQSSYCAKVRAEAKKRLTSFLDEPREETLATQATQVSECLIMLSSILNQEVVMLKT